MNKIFKLYDEIVRDIKNPKLKHINEWLLFQLNSYNSENKNETKNIKFRRYKRGSLVYVDFGLGIGSEFSGKHFAIILDKNDNPHKSKVTVVPLTSKPKKEGLPLGKELVDELYKHLIFSKFKLIQINSGTILRLNIKSSDIIFKYLTSIIKNTLKIRISENGFYYLSEDDLKKVLVIANNQIDYLLNLYSKYNKETFAVVNNITTVSKFKIQKPLNDLDNLNDIVLSEYHMSLIDKELINTYTK